MPKVLVIDDNDLVSSLLEQALCRLGYGVSTASGGRQGLRLFHEDVFDLVITDLVMPDMDGCAVARHVNTPHGHHTPIIGISGMPWLLSREVFDRVLTKPFSLKALRQAVEELLPRSAICGRTSLDDALGA